MIKEFRLPDLGEGLTESEIVAWKVAVGDTVTLNQIIAEVETAKAVVELPSPFAGVVAALHEQPGTVVEVGKPIVSFEIEGDDGGGCRCRRRRRRRQARAEPGRLRRRPRSLRPARPPRPHLRGPGRSGSSAAAPVEARGAAAPAVAAAPVVAPVQTRVPEPVETKPAATVPGERPRSTPPVRKLAKDLGVDLEAVTGTGEHGLITRDDVRNFVGGGDLPAAVQGLGVQELAGAPAQATGPAAGRAGDPHSDQGRAQVHGRRDGGQRLHRTARHRVPDRRRHAHDGAAGTAARPAARSPATSSRR